MNSTEQLPKKLKRNKIKVISPENNRKYGLGWLCEVDIQVRVERR
jgi:hypothetical protein